MQALVTAECKKPGFITSMTAGIAVQKGRGNVREDQDK